MMSKGRTNSDTVQGHASQQGWSHVLLIMATMLLPPGMTADDKNGQLQQHN